MKKAVSIVFVMFLIFMVGCGSDSRNETVSNQLPANVDGSSTIDDTGGITDNVNEITNDTDTDEMKYTEKIAVAVSVSYALKYPDFEKKIQDQIDHQNIVLNRNPKNKKRLEVGKKEFYRDEDLESMYYNGGISNQRFIYNNWFPKAYGTTLVLCFYKGEANKPKIFTEISESCRGIHRTRTMSNGIKLEEAWIACDENNSPFTNLSLGTEEYEQASRPVTHEFGHCWGLSEEELYRYVFGDSSGELPILEDFHPWDLFANDPMYTDNIPLKFTEFNSWFINENVQHDLTARQVSEEIPKVIKVLVTKGGIPVEGATVRVFAARLGNSLNNVFVTSPVLLLEVVTNEDGEAIINSDDLEKVTYKGHTFRHKLSPDVLAKIIKVEYGNLYSGCYFTLYEAEKAHLQDGEDIHTIKMQLGYIFPY